MSRQLLTIAAAAVLVLSLPVLGGADSLAQIVLSEMLADPANDWNGDGEVHYRDDEWIEVTNVGAYSVDLSIFHIKDALGDDPQLYLFGTLDPGQAAVFYGSDAVAWQQANGLSVTGLSLNNAGDTIELVMGLPGEPDQQLVDFYIYLDHEADDDRASGRLPATGEWALFDGLNLYDGSTEPLGTGCNPDPGIVNVCIPNVADYPTSWGKVKADYR